MRRLQSVVPFIMHPVWPLSVFSLSRPFTSDIFILISIVFVWKLMEKKFDQTPVGIHIFLPYIISLTILTNLFQGYQYGLVQPVMGHGNRDFSYWSDASMVQHMGAVKYLKNYTVLQPTVGYHARVHPPGPVLLLSAMRSILKYPELISISMLLISSLSIILLYQYSLAFTSPKNAQWISLLYGLLPAVQIYSLASIDALVAMFSIGALGSWILKKRGYIIQTFIFTVLVAAFNFSIVWLIAVLAVISYQRDGNSFVKLSMLMGLAYISIRVTTGYDYLHSFQVAASFEGVRDGFYGFIDPASYLATRMQDLLEPLVFLGPGVGLSIIAALRRPQHHPLRQLARASIIIFGIFLLFGAYYTGETARAALYLIPPLLLNLSLDIEVLAPSKRHMKTMLRLVCIQTVIMQIMGYYSW